MTRAILYSLSSILAFSPQVRSSAVTLQEDDATYTLSNGTLTATIDKHTGGLPSLTYNNLPLLNQAARGRDAGYWSHSAASDRMETRITLDPKSNNGDAAEVSIKGFSDSKPMGSGPGGSTLCDVEIRFTLLRDTPGLYTWSTFTHQPSYPATGIGEARFLLKLNDDVFDWMTVDSARSMKMLTAHDWNYGIPLTMKEVRLLTTGDYKGKIEHKYDYSANQFDTPAWGWSSTKHHVGIWYINPTIEYLSGGPTKIELSAHRDATFNPDAKTAPAPPCLLNYWRGSHYGGSSVSLAQGESWSKTIGPFLIYCNTGDSPESLHKDALSRVPTEQKAWPYPWAHHPDYPSKEQRGTLTGHFTLNDPQLGTRNSELGTLKNLQVGLTHPAYEVRGFRGTQTIDWQNDAKYYQFWTRADPDGTFTLPSIRPGTYTLHALADNVLGEFAQQDITINPNQTLDLKQITWTPTRHGQQLWEIGTPNRSASEFLHGDHANQYGLYFQYPLDFPHDVHYTVGQSGPSKDWPLMQVPHSDLPPNFQLPPSTTTPPSQLGTRNSELGTTPPTFPKQGRATPWTITFQMDHTPTKGTATLRLAFAGTESRSLDVSINDQKLPPITGLANTSSIHRDSNTSFYQTRDLPFPATHLKEGQNTLTLTVPPGPPTAGIMYDYLRLELDESQTPAP